MKKIAALLALFAGLLYLSPVHAQTFVVASCPAAVTKGAAGQTGRPYAIDVNGNLCIAGTISTTITGTSFGTTAADNVTAPTSALDARSFNHVWDGATWDRLYGDSTNGAFVNIKSSIALTAAVTAASGALASGAMVDLVALSAPVAPATATATKSALIGCQATSAAINPATGQQAAIDCDLNNNILVSPGGAPNYVTSQVSVATSDTSVAAARALRRAIRITNVTGTQQVWCSGTTAAANTAELIPAVVGASLMISTTSAVRCIASTGAQTVTVAEIY